MKKTIILMAILGLFLINPFSVTAQYTSPSDPGGNPQVGGETPLGGSAPVGGGMFILLGLSAAYGGKKLYRLFDDDNNELNEKHKY
jgi:hypothetical protein